MLPFPVLIADVGGTNARFACLEAAGAPMSPVVRLDTAGIATFADGVRLAVARGGFARPRSLLVGAAGPVRDRAVRMTNASWLIDGPTLARDLDLDQGLLFNDFETISLALPALTAEDWRAIGPDRPNARGTLAVIGPGTGLGVGALARRGGRWLPLSSEGGHGVLAPRDGADAALWPQLAPAGHDVVAERLLAGPGLARLHAALGGDDGPSVADPSAITQRALAGTDALCQRTVVLWLEYLARFSRDMALTFLASGGVYLAGGIVPRLARLIDTAAFRAAFEAHPTHRAVLEAMPVRLITAPEPALIGLAAFAAAPSDYEIDAVARIWR